MRKPKAKIYYVILKPGRHSFEGNLEKSIFFFLFSLRTRCDAWPLNRLSDEDDGDNDSGVDWRSLGHKLVLGGRLAQS